MSELISSFEGLNIDISQYRTDQQTPRRRDYNYLYENEDSTGINDPRYGDLDKDNDIEGKLFVGGISWQTTEEGLSFYFSKFGALADVALMKDKYTGQPRGFGFIKFEDSSSLDVVLAQGDHTINGRVVDVKRAVKKSEAPGPARNLRPLESNKVFVGGLAPSVSVTEFRNYFESFGIVVDAVVMFDRQTQRSRGFGFVTFQDENVVQTVLMGIHEINGKMVEVKHAEPKDSRRSSAFSISGRSPSSYSSLYGSAFGGRTRHLYLPRTALSAPYTPQSYSLYGSTGGDTYGSAYGPTTGAYPPYNTSYMPYSSNYNGTGYSDDSYVNHGYRNSESDYINSPSAIGGSSQYQSLLSSYGIGPLPTSNSYLEYSSSLRNQFDESNQGLSTNDRRAETQDFSIQHF